MEITPGLRPKPKPEAGSRITVENDIKIGKSDRLNVYGGEVLEGHREVRGINKVQIDDAKDTDIHALRELKRDPKAGPA